MRRFLAPIALGLAAASCVVSPNLDDLPPPCATGYHEDPVRHRCVLGDAPEDAGHGVDAHVPVDAFVPTDGFVPSDAHVPTIDLTDCVLHFGMEEPSWTGAAGEVVDDCGAPNPGTLHGTANTVASGVVGRAGYFSGNGCVQIDDEPGLHPSSALTIAAWFNTAGLTDTSTYGIVSKRWTISRDCTYDLSIWDNRYLHFDIDLEESRATTSLRVDNSIWYHVALVFDATLPVDQRATVYIDGSSIGTFPENEPDPNISPFTTPVFVGCLPYADALDQYFVGYLDEVYVFHRPLSESEVGDLYAIGRAALDAP